MKHGRRSYVTARLFLVALLAVLLANAGGGGAARAQWRAAQAPPETWGTTPGMSDAQSSPKWLRRAASTSTWNGCGSKRRANSTMSSAAKP